MPRRSTLLFDVMGTLVYDPFFVEVPAFFGMTLEELLVAKHPTAWMDFETGTIEEGSLLARFFRDGRSFDHEGLKRCLSSAYRFIDGMDTDCSSPAISTARSPRGSGRSRSIPGLRPSLNRT